MKPYNPIMGRKLTRRRPAQGTKLAALRKAAGLSQYELADLVRVSQSAIAFWEVSNTPPRSSALPKLAKALGVKVENLLNGNTSLNKTRGPKGKLRRLFEEVSKLPRGQQAKVIEFVSAFVDKQQH